MNRILINRKRSFFYRAWVGGGFRSFYVLRHVDQFIKNKLFSDNKNIYFCKKNISDEDLLPYWIEYINRKDGRVEDTKNGLNMKLEKMEIMDI